jgi:hypothetical protein
MIMNEIAFPFIPMFNRQNITNEKMRSQLQIMLASA